MALWLSHSKESESHKWFRFVIMKSLIQILVGEHIFHYGINVDCTYFIRVARFANLNSDEFFCLFATISEPSYWGIKFAFKLAELSLELECTTDSVSFSDFGKLKSRPVLWIVSNCYSHKRMAYYQELTKHMQVRIPSYRKELKHNDMVKIEYQPLTRHLFSKIVQAFSQNKTIFW